MWCQWHSATLRTCGVASTPTLAWRFPYDDRSETPKDNRYPLSVGPVQVAQALLGPLLASRSEGTGCCGASRGYGSRCIASRTVLICQLRSFLRGGARPTHSPPHSTSFINGFPTLAPRRMMFPKWRHGIHDFPSEQTPPCRAIASTPRSISQLGWQICLRDQSSTRPGLMAFSKIYTRYGVADDNQLFSFFFRSYRSTQSNEDTMAYT